MNARRDFIAMVLALAAGTAFAQRPAPNFQQPDNVRLPLTIDGSVTEVVANLYKPAGPGPFPLVLFAHGRAGTQQERAGLKFPIGIGHANYWLNKGVAVLAPIRPGYGETGGSDTELLATGAVEGGDGHQLINRGPNLWRAALDGFVRKVGLLAP